MQRATVRFFPTSSLDIVEPLAPFVPATAWNQMLRESRDSNPKRTPSDSKPFYRDALVHAIALNQDQPSCSLDQRSIGRSKNPFQVRLELETPTLSAVQVDSCFAGGEFDFLLPPVQQENSYELQADEDSESYDLELGLLESVQEIAISLYREPARRVQQEVQ